jgi:hypothetical protein
MQPKEKKQAIILAVTLAGIVGALLYFYRTAFFPQPVRLSPDLPVPQRLREYAGSDEVMRRDDFQALERFGDVPVRPVAPSQSSTPLFEPQSR